MERQPPNLLAALSRPPGRNNLLAELAYAQDPISALPAQPVREGPAVPEQPSFRDMVMAELLNPNSAFNRYGMGFIGPAAVNIVGRGARGIRAFHGSPHEFDRFDLSRIGTGATADRWATRQTQGIYLTTSRPHAASYGRPLEFNVAGRMLDVNARQELANWARENGYRSAQDMINRYYGGDVYAALNADSYFSDALRRALSDGYDGARVRFGSIADTTIQSRPQPIGDVLIINNPDLATRVR
jgi:hypothetical protein